MIAQWSKKSAIFPEFSPDFQKEWFDYRKDAVCHHVDSLYYTVYLEEPDPSVFYEEDSEDLLGVPALLYDLQEAKARKCENRAEELLFFGDLSLTLGAFSIYQYHLQVPECYDVFIASSLPNPQTPRIVVQLRTNYLVNEMLCVPEDAVEDSLAAVRALLASYAINIDQVQANRIDYAFHMNIVQNMGRYFSNNLMTNKLCTTLRRYDMSGKINGRGRQLGLDYISFGRRTSNDIFVRIYNKTQEVVELNYKSFFFGYWREKGLISKYDQWVLEEAYKCGSYRSGILVGRIKWYLEYGTNEELREELAKIKLSDYVKSDNCQDMEKRIDGILPPVTLIVNIEYQTKKHFFDTCVNDTWQEYSGSAEARPLYTTIHHAPRIIDYLTSQTLCFREYDDSYCYFWERLRGSALCRASSTSTLVRKYARNVDGERSRRRCLGALATQAIIKSGSMHGNVEQDVASALCCLNDNDLHGRYNPYDQNDLEEITEDTFLGRDLVFMDAKTGETFRMNDGGYKEIRERRARQYRRYLRERGDQSAIS